MELMVVMGILLLMMSLLLPVVGPMMNRAELNKIVSTIIGQLEVGNIKSLEFSQVTRVSFEFDPIGKNISKADVASITGLTINSDTDEIEARQSNTPYREFDINNDGVVGGYCNQQSLWIKVYLCPGNHRATPFLKDIVKMVDGTPVSVARGPFWLRRPISRMRDLNGNFKPTKLFLKPIWDGGEEKWYYFRPLINDGLDKNCSEKLMPTENDGTCYLINDTGAKLDYNLSASEIKNYTGGCVKTYNDSVAIYKSKESVRIQFLYGKDIDEYFKDKPLPKDRVYQITTEWFDIFEGDIVDPKNLDYGANEDEDRLIDEGMSVSVATYNQSKVYPAVILRHDLGMNYSIYFGGIEDNDCKIGREYFIGGKVKKGVMLRRVWGVYPGKNKKVLLWSFNKIIKPENKVRISTPYYFYIVFDQKNGESGMSFGTNYGAEQMGQLFFQISDDDNKLSTIISFSDGYAKEGNLQEMGFPSSKSGLDALDYYQGTK